MLFLTSLPALLARTLLGWAFVGPTAPPQAVQAPSGPGEPPPPPTWVDVDGDDLPDLFLARPDGDRLLVNRGEGLFEERIALTGLDAVPASRLALWVDFDGDRRPDVYRVGSDGVGGLWRNMGDGTFAEVSDYVGLPRTRAVLDARWVDVDLDMAPDLEVTCLAGVTVYRNLAGRGFEPILSLPARSGTRPAPGTAPLGEVGGEDVPPPAAGSGSRGATASGGITVAEVRPGGQPAEESTRTPFCAFGVQDQAIQGSCITASSAPTLGMLYPLSSNLYVALSGNVGIGTLSPATRLDVAGKTRTSSLQVTGGASTGKVLTSDAVGNATWQTAPGGGVGGSGTAGTLPRFTGIATLGDSSVSENGMGWIGVGTLVPEARLHVRAAGDEPVVRVEGPGPDGGFGRVTFGLGPDDTYVSEGETNGLYLVAPTGVGMGPGNVGIKVTSLSVATHSLTVAGNALQEDILRLIGPDGSYGHGAQLSFGDGDYVELEEDEDDHLQIRSRLGTTVTTAGTAAEPALEVLQAVGSGINSPALKLENTSTSQGIGIFSQTWGTDANAVFTQKGTGHVIKGFVGGTLKFEVRNDGRVVCRSLEITGGSDLVEAFEADVEVVPGTVMCIDPGTPGQLTPARGAYDSRVAGVVSGAGGIEPGLHLRQEGVADGEVLVAMTGRVYVRCSAENGAIRPGDLLTTAEREGHAMRADDPARAFGAVIGKAMSALDEGTGLVLVLVNLQ